jgi:hypothetical protein
MSVKLIKIDLKLIKPKETGSQEKPDVKQLKTLQSY